MTTSGQPSLLERPDHDPWVLVNLLRFNHRVSTADGEKLSGAGAYERYLAACQPVLDRFGATILWAGDAQFAVAGLPDTSPSEQRPQWDRVVVVRYPTAAAYRAIVGDPEFRMALPLKDAAVAETEVLVCSPDGAFEPKATAAPGSGD